MEKQVSNLNDAQKNMCNANLCKISDGKNFLCRYKGHSAKPVPFASQENEQSHYLYLFIHFETLLKQQYLSILIKLFFYRNVIHE